MALREIIEPFVVGPGGRRMTPEQVARERKVAAALMESGADYSPIGHWLQGATRLANAGVGAFQNWQLDQQEQAGHDNYAANSFLTRPGGNLASGDDTSGVAAALADPSGGGNAAQPAGGGGDFMSGLVNSESGGNWNALNNEGYGGRLQFGDARLADAAKAGVIPAGVTGAAFSQMSPEQQQAVEQWHFADIDRQAQGMGLDRYYGQTIAGVPITPESVKAMAHLGGIGGAQKFITSGGQYNPADSNGTRLSDYGSRFGGGGGQPSAQPAPVQVASLDPSIGAPQQAQLPPVGPAGGPSLNTASQAPNPTQAIAQALAPQGGANPTQNSMSPSMQEIAQVLGDPWAPSEHKEIARLLYGQMVQQQDPRYQQQLRAGDLGIQKSEFELNQMLNPSPAKPEYGFEFAPDGTLIRTDKASGGFEPMGQFGKPEDGLTDTQRNLAWRAEQAGLTAGTPEYAEFMRSGGQSTGMALTVGPDGTVQFAQGAGVSGKPLTESQSKDTVYVTRAQGALPLLDQYGGALTDYRTEVTKDFPLFGNATKSPEYQQAEQAGLEFLQAVLRKDTGAAITPDETAEYGKVYLPRPGDSPQVLEQKRMSRARAVAAIEAGMPPEAILAAEKAALAAPDAAPNAAGAIDDLLEKYH